MNWWQKIVVLFVSSMAVGISPALMVAYANQVLDPGVCWPNVYGAYLLIPTGISCAAWGLCFAVWLEDKLNVCGHTSTNS